MKKKYTTPSLDVREYQLLEALMNSGNAFSATESDTIIDGDDFFG